MKIFYFFLELFFVIVLISSCKKSNKKYEELVCKDIDGNTYGITRICSNNWTTDNLKVSHYRNGDIIPQVQNDSQWENLTTGAWCWYRNDSVNFSQYGKLYNWYALNDSRGLAPMGWHIPTEDEWDELSVCLGGQLNAGGKLKTRGTIQASTGLWQAPNSTLEPYSNFNGLPGGYRDMPGQFIGLGYYNYWWSSTPAGTSTAGMRVVINFLNNLNKGSYGYKYGFYVRCIKE